MSIGKIPKKEKWKIRQRQTSDEWKIINRNEIYENNPTTQSFSQRYSSLVNWWLNVFVWRIFLSFDRNRFGPQQINKILSSRLTIYYDSNSMQTTKKLLETKVTINWKRNIDSIRTTRHELCVMKIRDKTAHTVYIAITKTQTLFNKKNTQIYKILFNKHIEIFVKRMVFTFLHFFAN